MICNNLEEVRSNIDRIDDAIIKLIAERGGYVTQASHQEKRRRRKRLFACGKSHPKSTRESRTLWRQPRHGRSSL